jgi:hypothetical protein
MARGQIAFAGAQMEAHYAQLHRREVELAKIAAGEQPNRTPGPKFLASRGIPTGPTQPPDRPSSPLFQTDNLRPEAGRVNFGGHQPGRVNPQLGRNVPPAPLPAPTQQQFGMSGPNRLSRFLNRNTGLGGLT